MSFNHRHLRELLDLARANQPAEDLRLPSHLQARILSVWRATRLAQERLELTNIIRLLRLFRLGLGVACALALIIIAFSLHRLHRDPYDQLASPVSVINLALKP